MKRIFVLIVIVLLPMALIGCSGANTKVDKTKTLFTKVNIWFENPGKILATNYHKGSVLPINTRINVIEMNRKLLRFKDLSTNVVFTLFNVPKHTKKNIDELFDAYFATLSVNLDSFSALEQENIKNGTIAVGMSKAAVIAAYGYPPGNKTPSLDYDLWTYWVSRFKRTRGVKFSAGAIVEIL